MPTIPEATKALADIGAGDCALYDVPEEQLTQSVQRTVRIQMKILAWSKRIAGIRERGRDDRSTAEAGPITDSNVDDGIVIISD